MHHPIRYALALIAAGTIGGLTAPLIAVADPSTTYSHSTTFQPAADPVRVLDTRESGVMLRAGEPITVTLPEIPHSSTDTISGQQTTWFEPANTVVVNVTVDQPTADGFVRVWPAGSAEPEVSNLNFRGNEPEAGLVVVGVRDGQIQLVASVDTHVIVDLFGQFDALVPAAVP